MNVYNSLIHNGKTWKQPRHPTVGEGINAVILHPGNGIWFNSEKKWVKTSQTRHGGSKCILLEKAAIWKGCKMYETTSIMFWKR